MSAAQGHPERPDRLGPGETRALIDGTGATITFLWRHPLSVDPTPNAIQMPTEQLLLIVCQAVIQQAQHVASKQSGVVTPNVLPGTGGPIKT